MQKILAEFLGTAFLLIGVVGSGIMGQSLADGNIAIALLANAIATGCVLYVAISILGPISGAHFNPVVTMVFWMKGELGGKQSLTYLAAQISGGIIGVWVTHLMFDLTVFQTSLTDRTGINLWISELVATIGLLLVILGGIRNAPSSVPALVGLYITGAYWFTSSTSFANPAVSIARGLSDTFAGVNPSHVPMFILCQIVGALIAYAVARKLFA